MKTTFGSSFFPFRSLLDLDRWVIIVYPLSLALTVARQQARTADGRRMFWVTVISGLSVTPLVLRHSIGLFCIIYFIQFFSQQ